MEVVSTKTTADVMWKDGRLEKNIRSNDLIPIQHIDTHEFCPGDLVVDKRCKTDLVLWDVSFLFYGLLTWLPFVIVLLAQALQDPGVYGVIQSGDHKARTCVVKWVKLNSSSDDVEVSHQNLKNPDLKNHPLSSALCHLPRPGSGHRGGR